MTRSGHAYTPAKTRAFEDKLKQAYAEAPLPGPMEGPLNVHVILYLEKPKASKGREFPSVRPDLDNYVKAILDAADGIIWKDDGQICVLHAHKFYGDPKIILIVQHATSEDQQSVESIIAQMIDPEEPGLDVFGPSSGGGSSSAPPNMH